MSDFSDTSVRRRRCITTLHSVALAAALAVSAPAWAQSAQEDSAKDRPERVYLHRLI